MSPVGIDFLIHDLQLLTGACFPPALPVGVSLVQMLITGSWNSLATWSSYSPASPALFCIVGMICTGTLQVPQDTAWPYTLAGRHRVSSNTSDICKLLRKSVSCPRHEARALHTPRLHRIWLQGLRVCCMFLCSFPLKLWESSGESSWMSSLEIHWVDSLEVHCCISFLEEVLKRKVPVRRKEKNTKIYLQACQSLAYWEIHIHFRIERRSRPAYSDKMTYEDWFCYSERFWANLYLYFTS